MTEELYDNSAPVVDTNHGQVRGSFRSGVYGDPYYSFEGVPYAAPPLGSFRFRSPQPLQSWTGVKDCQEPAAMCLQLTSKGTVEGSEDCLYLSIYAKQLRSAQPLPVIVYVHGGRFRTGDYTRRLWAPDYLMRQPLLLITVGHRLGAFGYLSLADAPALDVAGNAGLKDLIQALRWVQANASSFNGDPSRVTLAGHSSGSMSVQWLLGSPRTEGLFQRAILEGGFVTETTTAPNLAYRLAVAQGYEGAQESSGILDFLRDLPAERLLQFKGLSEQELAQNRQMVFLPSIEAAWSADAVLTVEPLEALRSSWANHIPLLLGATSEEALSLLYGKYTTDPSLYGRLQSRPEQLLPATLQLRCPLELQRSFAEQLLALHFPPGELNASHYREALELESFDFAYHPLHRLLESRRRHASQPTFLLRFAHDSPSFGYFKNRATGGVHVPGVGHADELLFLFFMPGFSEAVSEQSEEHRTIRRMVSLWSAFAASGDPNTAELGTDLVWKPVERQGAYKCLNVDKEVALIESPELRKCLVMDSWYDQAGLPLF